MEELYAMQPMFCCTAMHPVRKCKLKMKEEVHTAIPLPLFKFHSAPPSQPPLKEFEDRKFVAKTSSNTQKQLIPPSSRRQLRHPPRRPRQPTTAQITPQTPHITSHLTSHTQPNPSIISSFYASNLWSPRFALGLGFLLLVKHSPAVGG